MKKISPFLILAFLTVQFSPAAYPETVRAIFEDGQLELEDGRRVQLAGILPPPEGLRMLPVLLAGQEVDLEHDSALQKAVGEGQPLPVYMYVMTSEISLPHGLKGESRKKKVMVNEIMLAIGAAQVDGKLSFKWKKRFSEIEAEARKKGEGIWSYSGA